MIQEQIMKRHIYNMSTITDLAVFILNQLVFYQELKFLFILWWTLSRVSYWSHYVGYLVGPNEYNI